MEFSRNDENRNFPNIMLTPQKGALTQTNKTPLSSTSNNMSAKQKAILDNKINSAQRVREERERLREIKRRKQEDFLQRSADRRNASMIRSNTRKQILQNEREAKVAKQQQEIAGMS